MTKEVTTELIRELRRLADGLEEGSLFAQRIARVQNNDANLVANLAIEIRYRVAS